MGRGTETSGGIGISGFKSGTATGEVNATDSREAKMIFVAAMICGINRRFRVSSGFGYLTWMQMISGVEQVWGNKTPSYIPVYFVLFPLFPFSKKQTQVPTDPRRGFRPGRTIPVLDISLSVLWLARLIWKIWHANHPITQEQKTLMIDPCYIFHYNNIICFKLRSVRLWTDING